MTQFTTEVIDVIERTSGVKSFRFKTEKNALFRPGQFFFVEIDISGEKRTKHFSFSNSPTEKGYIEFTKRITESPFSGALDTLKVGARANLKMPYGTFTFEGEYPKIAFLSGGIGITPIRSMCKFATDKKLKTDMILFYGNTAETDIIFREDFDRMRAKNENLRVVYTLTSPDAAWKGRTGYIDENMIKQDMPDFQDRIFYLCGPPSMVKSLSRLLSDKLGVASDKIKMENFTGY